MSDQEYLTTPAPTTNAGGQTIIFYDWGTNVNPRDRYRCRIEDGHGLGIADAATKQLALGYAQEDYTQHD